MLMIAVLGLLSIQDVTKSPLPNSMLLLLLWIGLFDVYICSCHFVIYLIVKFASILDISCAIVFCWTNAACNCMESI